MNPNPATVTVVTGPPGVDIGPAVAHLGRDLGDGLAIRTVVSTPELYGGLAFSRKGAHEHLSPAPPWSRPPGGSGTYDRGVPLWSLPSCWQNPDTNLGVAYTGAVTRDLAGDCRTLDEIGCDVKHRLAVQYRAVGRAGALAIPPPIEVGDLAEAARDSVLRGSSSRHVLIEAGDGQTFPDAMHTVGIWPGSTHIDEMALRLVVDLGHVTPDGDFPAMLAPVHKALVSNGGGLHAADGTWQPARGVGLVALGLHRVFPQAAGITSFGDIQDPGVAYAIVAWLGNIAADTGVLVRAASTGDGPNGPWLDLP